MLQIDMTMHGLEEYLGARGYSVATQYMSDGTTSILWHGGTEAEVQAAIDSYDPLPIAKRDAEAKVKAAAHAARQRYTDDSKQAIYLIKSQQAADYLTAVAANGGLDLADMTGFEQIAIEQSAFPTGTATEAAQKILAMRGQWMQVVDAIESIARPAIEQVRVATDWTTIAPIADAAVAKLEAI